MRLGRISAHGSGSHRPDLAIVEVQCAQRDDSRVIRDSCGRVDLGQTGRNKTGHEPTLGKRGIPVGYRFPPALFCSTKTAADGEMYRP